MRIAVTGASGFVGGAIADHLASIGYDVLALGRRARPTILAYDYVSWDLTGDEPAPPVLARCDAVVHAAAHVAPWGPDGPFREITVGGTQRLLRVLDAGARLVVIGSASVYDPRAHHLLATEGEAPVALDRYLNAYGRAKANQERIVREQRPDAVVLRPRAVWGPGDTTLLPRILARIQRGRLALPAGGRHPMSTTHISSLTAAVSAALDRPDVVGPVNVADATTTTAAQLLTALFEARRMPVRIVAVPSALAWAVASATEGLWRLAGLTNEPPLTRFAIAGLVRPFTLDLGRLHRELGVRPDVDVAWAAAQLAERADRRSLSGGGPRVPDRAR